MKQQVRKTKLLPAYAAIELLLGTNIGRILENNILGVGSGTDWFITAFSIFFMTALMTDLVNAYEGERIAAVVSGQVPKAIITDKMKHPSFISAIAIHILRIITLMIMPYGSILLYRVGMGWKITAITLIASEILSSVILHNAMRSNRMRIFHRFPMLVPFHDNIVQYL